jgi:hypothetical protein
MPLRYLSQWLTGNIELHNLPAFSAETRVLPAVLYIAITKVGNKDEVIVEIDVSAILHMNCANPRSLAVSAS